MVKAKTDTKFRHIESDELPGLLTLFKFLHIDDAPLPDEPRLGQIWHEFLTDSKVHCLVAEADNRLVATCTLTIIPNLTRGATPYGLIENVVTHGDYRRQGIATGLMNYARMLAKEEHCHKVMLITQRQEESTLRFYDNAGFQRNGRTAFVAYLDK
ncbi:MAG: GNAT family N-acetyltransferase [Dehalococcoidales bacterium]|nr:GNAT family N-acetyltransferase [Dehalococcoidales bacterium]